MTDPLSRNESVVDNVVSHRVGATVEKGKLVQFDVARGIKRNQADDVESAR